jgi:hypothetical protein
MRDEDIIQVQLGRRPRGFLKVASRCPLGMPETIITSPVVTARPGFAEPEYNVRYGSKHFAGTKSPPGHAVQVK